MEEGNHETRNKEKAEELIRALKGFKGRLLEAEGFRVFSMDAEMHL
jgi:hypothetical protein